MRFPFKLPGFPRIKFPRLRLYQQIIVCFLLVVFIPLMGVSFIIYSINQTALKKELVKFTEHTADSIYKDLETEIAWQQEQMKTLGHFLKAQYGFTHQFPQVAQEVLTLSTDTDSVAWYDAEGKNLGSVYRNYAHLSPELRLPIKLETTPNASNSKIEFQVLYSNTGNAEDNTYYLRALIPLASLGSQSNSSGYYMIQKKFNFLAQLIHANTKTLHSSVYIIDNTGMILAGPLGNQSERQFINPKDFAFFQSIPDGVTQEYSTTAPTTLFTHAPQGKLSDEDTEDLPPLQKVFVKMPTIGWGILLESPYNVRQTYVKRARDQSLLLIIACMALVILLALFYILGINRNFRQLIKALKAMAEGNYSRRIRLITNTTTPMEIVFLTGEFNRMARKMADAWNKSQELNQELMRKHDEESFLSRTTKMLHGTLSLDEISTITTHQVAQFFEAAVCVLALKPSSSDNPQEEQAVWVFENGSFPEIRGLSPEVWEDSLDLPTFHASLQEGFGQPIILSSEKALWLKAFQLGEALVMPIVYQENLLGFVLLVREANAKPFSLEDCHLISLMTAQVAVAIQQANQWQTIQQANEKLAKLDELKSNLIDTVSHELRTPLTSIKGYTSRLLRYEDSLDSPTRMKSLKVIKQQADRLGRLVEDLLVIPDLETANLRVFPDQVSLLDILERSVQSIQEKGNREILIHSPSQPIPSIMADPDRLEQVLINLLDNGMKYSIPDTPIEIEVQLEPPGNFISVKVKNRSSDIPKEALPKLFQKFKRLDDGLTRTTRGSGLGLFITKGLVEAMSGHISLHSEKGYFSVMMGFAVFEENRLARP